MPAPKKKRTYREDVAESILQARELSAVYPLDLLGLGDDWSPIPGCAGPSLSEWKRPRRKTKDELNSFRRSLEKRYSHLVAACKDDNERLLLLNNAMIYLETETEFRLRVWLSRSTYDKDVTPRWPRCSNQECSKTSQTAKGPKGCKMAVEPVWTSGTADAEGKAPGEGVISISSDNSSQSGSDSESTASGRLLACICGQKAQSIRSLVKHGRHCERVSASARARDVSVDRDKCLYDCATKTTKATYWIHEKRLHYICQGCGEVVTKLQGHKFASLQPIDPVDYFLRPKKEFEKRKPDEVIKEALMSMLPCEAKEVAKLNDVQLVSIFRSGLEQRAALAFASSDFPDAMNEGLGPHQDAPLTGIDPENETENRNNPVRLLESNAPASPIQQRPRIAADSPTVALGDCTILGRVGSVNSTPASSAVEPPSTSFLLPGDGQVNLDSAPASPPEDDAQDPSYGLSTCEYERSQPLYSRNDGLSNGSDATPDQARPDTTSNVEPLLAARTAPYHSHGSPIEAFKDGTTNPTKRKRKGDSQVNKGTLFYMIIAAVLSRLMGKKPAMGTGKRFRSATIVLGQNYRSPSCDRIPTPYSLSPPRNLLAIEQLLDSVKGYFKSSCQNMSFDDDQNLVTPSGYKLDNALCGEFDSYCFTATMLIQKRLSAEFGRTLSKACHLVERILRAQHPRTLVCFLEVFVHLIQSRLPEVATHLCSFVAQMAVAIGKERGPLGTTYELLSNLDQKSLYQAMVRIWKCISDTFDSELGRGHRLAVSIRLDYIKRVVADHKEEESLLMDLLGQFRDTPQLSTPRVMLNLAHNLSKQECHDKAEDMALKVSSLLQKNVMYTSRVVEKIECLKVISRSQFHQGKIVAAKQTMLEAIQMIEAAWGMEHPWVTEFKSVLEGWLRLSGREQEANILREEIASLIGEVGID
ncbi:Tetratricopeptide-like helical domain superfamily [Fusarium oxysporum f. sp. vasinfectum]|uniref:Clr5 domain-containing protein n=1 Tax=Fusarium oxysporum f. sp. vasinfectum 25433 TaxID=1089449 RepID=X0KLT9_FUSOX|nr:hypothetical protein FOTG_17091 [Fusarium oxysporum f. sp. vasinfectum 25433]KAK2667776.1 Tetratricopeptide-like helical domain superfamily [Fusarium oxysporum f. sp. vasinfectum]KAK2922914.1 Tetratricopeptide-like helical domain superfamily [Fusarium oxysporum f. sp. vasinfectum]